MGEYEEISDYATYTVYEAKVQAQVMDKWLEPHCLYRERTAYVVALQVPQMFPLGNTSSQCITRHISRAEYSCLYAGDRKEVPLYSPDALNTEQKWYLSPHDATHSQEDHPLPKRVFDEALREQ